MNDTLEMNLECNPMRIILLIMLAIGLAGCATTATQPRGEAVDNAALVDARAKLGLGRCSLELANEILALRNPGLEQEAAYTCLQQGQIPAVERLLADFQTRHPNATNQDYSAYLRALAEFVRFELVEGDDQERLTVGRRAHDGLVGFVRQYPDSAYRQEVAPRLEALHEGMAGAEYGLAMADIESGRRELGASRLRYVVEQYPRSDAASAASRWLEQRVIP
ncbi:outer membrane protein assembly factor BamD [Halopseudomonas pelagia]|uniref:outer membrane protein assembly factor BamD n=1 Tax=Halopseudomonas pelagia TaxID=553151 RepID=UPI0003A8C9FD|nr:outer membrane protein assembly factor BamD [Halopseudomonas pelagia]|tara:strand:- start:1380 stop:2045 length:666 start_codon:yes stop_codon:yes gene_type:complete